MDESAKKAFQIVAKALDEMELKYIRDEQNLCIRISMGTNEFDINTDIRVDGDRGLVVMKTRLPFKMNVGNSDSILRAAEAIARINYKFWSGGFNLDISDGEVLFMYVNSFRGMNLTTDVIKHMYSLTVVTTDKYDDRLFEYNAGKISLEQLLA